MELQASTSSPVDVRQESSAFQPPSHITFRAIAVGVTFGGLLCCSNMYFGLQTGWITMGSLQASLIGYGFFRMLRRVLRSPFTPFEHVVLQSTAVATATMPLAAGFVGIIPALGMLSDDDSPTGPLRFAWWQQLVWAGSLAFFGACFAVPLRRQLILWEQLRFPSGTATARMIQVLHATREDEAGEPEADNGADPLIWKTSSPHLASVFKRQMQGLWCAFSIGGSFQLLTLPFLLPSISRLPVFSWIGLPAVTEWKWTLALSPGYVGQGMIMGPRTTLSMLLGAVLGWAILGPTARALNWAPGPVGSLSDGGSGWILWVSLALMISDSLTDLLLVLLFTLIRRHGFPLRRSAEPLADPAPPQHLVPATWWGGGLIASSIVCVVGILIVLPSQRILVLVAAILLSLLCAALGVRALGETDLNPVSGIGKLTQLLFAAIAPGDVISNLVAGAIAEAGATQAGDMMQDLKCGHLVGASPRAQFYGQLVGSFFSVLFTVGAYQLYNYAYVIGEPPFEAPVAAVWLEMARILNGAQVATNVLPFCIAFGLYGMLSAVRDKVFPSSKHYFPSTMAVAIGMYISPNWTVPRVAGGLLEWFWRRRNPESHSRYCIVVASGFVLGEGMLSLVVCIIKAALQ